MDIEPNVTLCKIDIRSARLVDFGDANDASDDHKATKRKDAGAEQLLLQRKLQLVEFSDRQDQNGELEKDLHDGHGQPELQIVGIEGGIWATGEKVANWMAWVAYLDDHGGHAPADAESDEDGGGPAERRMEEDASIEEKDGDLHEDDDKEVEDTVDVHILLNNQYLRYARRRAKYLQVILVKGIFS